MKVHIFGAASFPGVANYALKKAADVYESKYGSDAADFVRNHFYVDGLISVSTVEEGVSLAKRTIELCKNAGFRLHKFVANNEEVLKSLPSSSVADGCKQWSTLPTERTLGILWGAGSDALQFSSCVRERPSTRRGVLSMVSSIFDPLGFLSPYVLNGKKILQHLCTNESDWDQPIPTSVEQKWKQWKDQIKYLNNVRIDRCYKPNLKEPLSIKSAELHHFCDASVDGYGEYSYLRLVDNNNCVKCSLVISKARVGPRKPTTIPRMELVAATVSVKIATILRRELSCYKNLKEHFWTDSKVVLGYIVNDAKRFHTFVANRVQLIRNSSELRQWHYISTKYNPADIASRGMEVEKLITSEIWWNGPKFLSDPVYMVKEVNGLPISNEDKEVRRVNVFAMQLTPVVPEYITTVLQKLSSWNKAKRIFALCLIFICKLKGGKRSGNIMVEDMSQAEKLLIRAAQQSEYPNWTKLAKLDPVKDEDGLLKVGGRLRKSDLSINLKHPVILPAKCEVTRLLVNHYHQKVHHQGRGITHNSIRSAGFWIVGGMSQYQDGYTDVQSVVECEDNLVVKRWLISQKTDYIQLLHSATVELIILALGS
ncbi:uncharacterized protein LOC117103009 [Anneissia japonica]|uniref:uncharacterized protein LOC117103009 n=1 Tax=Anneissia japonica TaxID=1529436 RepID=UPI001425B658|nr:uncharacterized protein LOC117103009 [Anneissia japonica]